MEVKKHLIRAGQTLSKNSPTILTGLSIGGLFTTAVLAVKATPRAITLLDEHAKNTIGSEYDRNDLSTKEIIKVVGKYYIPAIAVGLTSCFCIIAANHVNMKRNAALAGLYAITESAFKEYQNKIAQTIGQNKEARIHDAINTDHVIKNPPSQNEIILTGDGEVLCYDKLSGRYFKSDIEKIRKIINELNRNMISENYICLNDFYFEVGLGCTSLGDLMGWNIDEGFISEKFSSCLTPEENKPCLVIEFQYISPKYLS